MTANSSYLGIMLLDDVFLCIACQSAISTRKLWPTSHDRLSGRGQLREHDAARIAKMLDGVDRDLEPVGQFPFDSDWCEAIRTLSGDAFLNA